MTDQFAPKLYSPKQNNIGDGLNLVTCEQTLKNDSFWFLQDELQTTTRSYEGQLSMMSEHLAGMNEKLTTQKEEIDMLKYQLNNKVRFFQIEIENGFSFRA